MTEPSEDRFILLNRFIKHADIAAIRNELESGVSVNLENKHGWNLLMLAAIQGNVAIGELLISRGANTNRVSSQGTSAVSLAAIGGHVRFLKLLLGHGADPDCKLNGISINKWIPGCQFGPKKEAAIVGLLREYRPRILD